MAYYSTKQDYLNDQFRLPLIKAIMENDYESAVSLIDFICYKMISENNLELALEQYRKDNGLEVVPKNFSSFMLDYSNIINKPMKSWKKCEIAYTDKETKNKCDKFWKEHYKED